MLDECCQQFVTIMSLHDSKLKRAPLAAVATMASEGLERFAAAESLGRQAHWIDCGVPNA